MKQLTFYTAKVEEVYAYLADAIFQDICKALKRQLDAGKDLTLSEWQVQALSDTGQLTQDVLNRIAEVSNVAPKLVRDAVYAAGFDTVKEIDERLSHRETPTNFTTEVLQGLVDQARLNLDNLVNQSLISQNTAAGIYQDIISKVVAEVATGTLTREQAIAKVVNAWLDKGVPSGFVDRAGKTWAIDNYAKTVIKSTVNNAFNEVTKQRLNDYGLTTVLVGSHPLARPACAKIQGKVIDVRPMNQIPPGSPYRSVYDPHWNADYGLAHGHRGVNCAHPWLPFDPEFNENNMPQYDPQKAIEEEKIEQRRKAIANQIRKAKQKRMAFEALGDDKKVRYYDNVLNKSRARMVQYVKDNNLKREPSLERVYVKPTS